METASGVYLYYVWTVWQYRGVVIQAGLDISAASMNLWLLYSISGCVLGKGAAMFRWLFSGQEAHS